MTSAVPASAGHGTVWLLLLLPLLLLAAPVEAQSLPTLTLEAPAEVPQGRPVSIQLQLDEILTEALMVTVQASTSTETVELSVEIPAGQDFADEEFPGLPVQTVWFFTVTVTQPGRVNAGTGTLARVTVIQPELAVVPAALLVLPGDTVMVRVGSSFPLGADITLSVEAQQRTGEPITKSGIELIAGSTLTDSIAFEGLGEGTWLIRVSAIARGPSPLPGTRPAQVRVGLPFLHLATDQGEVPAGEALRVMRIASNTAVGIREINFIAFSPDGALVFLHGPNVLGVWKVRPAVGVLTQTFGCGAVFADTGGITKCADAGIVGNIDSFSLRNRSSVALSQDGLLLFNVGSGRIVTWQVNTAEGILHNPFAHTSDVPAGAFDLAVSSDGSLLFVLGSRDIQEQTLTVWQVDSSASTPGGRLELLHRSGVTEAQDMALSPDDSWVYISTFVPGDRQAWRVNPAGLPVLSEAAGDTLFAGVGSNIFEDFNTASPDSRAVLTVDGGQIYIRRAKIPAGPRRDDAVYPINEGSFNRFLLFSQDNLLFFQNNDVVRVWTYDAAAGTLQNTGEGATQFRGGTFRAISPDGGLLITSVESTSELTLQVYRVEGIPRRAPGSELRVAVTASAPPARNVEVTVTASQQGQPPVTAQAMLMSTGEAAEAVFEAGALAPGPWSFSAAVALSSAVVETALARETVRIARPALELAAATQVPAGSAVRVTATLAAALNQSLSVKLQARRARDGQMREITAQLTTGSLSVTQEFAAGVLAPGVWHIMAQEDLMLVNTAEAVSTVTVAGPVLSLSAPDSVDAGQSVTVDVTASTAPGREVMVMVTATLSGRPDVSPILATVTLGASQSSVAVPFAGDALFAGTWVFTVMSAPLTAVQVAPGTSATVRVRLPLLRLIAPPSVSAVDALQVTMDISAAPGREVRITVRGDKQDPDPAQTVPAEAEGSAILAADIDTIAVEFAPTELSSGIWRFTVTAVPSTAVQVAPGTSATVRVELPRLRLTLPSDTVTAGRTVTVTVSSLGQPAREVDVTVRATLNICCVRREAVVPVRLSPDTLEGQAEFAADQLRSGAWTIRVSQSTPQGVVQFEQEAAVILRFVVPQLSLMVQEVFIVGEELSVAVTASPPLAIAADIMVTATHSEGGTRMANAARIEQSSTMVQTVFPAGLIDRTGTWTIAASAMPAFAAEAAQRVPAEASEIIVFASLEAIVADVISGQEEAVPGQRVRLTATLDRALSGLMELQVEVTAPDDSPRPSVQIPVGEGDTEGIGFFVPDAVPGLWQFALAGRPSLDVSGATAELEVRVPQLSLHRTPAAADGIPEGSTVIIEVRADLAPGRDVQVNVIAEQDERPALTVPVILGPSIRTTDAVFTGSNVLLSGTWRFRAEADLVDFSQALTEVQVVPVLRLQRAGQASVPTGSTVTLAVQVSSALASTATVTVQATREADGASAAADAELSPGALSTMAEFGAGVLLPGIWLFTLQAVQPGDIVRIAARTSATVTVALPILRLQVAGGESVRRELSMIVIQATAEALHTTVGVTVSATTSTEVSAAPVAAGSGEVLLNASSFSGQATFASGQLSAGTWFFTATAMPANTLDTSEARARVRILGRDEAIGADLEFSPAAPVPGQVLELTASLAVTLFENTSLTITAAPPPGGTGGEVPVIIAGRSTQSSGFFIPDASGEWRFGITAQGLSVDAQETTVSVAAINLNFNAGEINADDLVLTLRYLLLCPPDRICPQDMLTSNLAGDGYDLSELQASLVVPDTVGDGVGGAADAADVIMLLRYLSGIRGSLLFPADAPEAGRDRRLRIIERLLSP